MQNDYLAMTEANTRITNYFVTAEYTNKYIKKKCLHSPNLLHPGHLFPLHPNAIIGI